MDKITLGDYKSFKNFGRRNHRSKTKKHWKHYFLDLEEEKFKTEWVSTLQALILKRKVYKIRKYLCTECGLYFPAVIRKESDLVECPDCD